MILNKDVLSKIAIGFSLIAMILSIVSLVAVNKIKNSISINDLQKKIPIEKKIKKIEEEVDEVEVIKPDGSIQKVKANKSSDQLGKIINEKSGLIRKKTDNNEQNLKDDKKIIRPVARKKENDKNTTKILEKKTDFIDNNETKRNSVFVIQIGVYKERKSAEKMCNNIKSSIGIKKCIVEQTSRNLFRSIVYGFNNKQSAEKIKKDISNKTGIHGMIKKQK